MNELWNGGTFFLCNKLNLYQACDIFKLTQIASFIVSNLCTFLSLIKLCSFIQFRKPWYINYEMQVIDLWNHANWYQKVIVHITFAPLSINKVFTEYFSISFNLQEYFTPHKWLTPCNKPEQKTTISYFTIFFICFGK